MLNSSAKTTYRLIASTILLKRITFVNIRNSLHSSKISSNYVSVALPYVWLLTSSVPSATSKQCLELTSSVPSATSKQCLELTSSVSSTTSKTCFELTSSVLSTTSKQCFEQPAASFPVCTLKNLGQIWGRHNKNPCKSRAFLFL